jgi:hypothetical protein
MFSNGGGRLRRRSGSFAGSGCHDDVAAAVIQLRERAGKAVIQLRERAGKLASLRGRVPASAVTAVTAPVIVCSHTPPGGFDYTQSPIRPPRAALQRR